MFKKFVLSSVCAVAVMLMAVDANAFHGQRRHGNSCGHSGNYGYTTSARSYYSDPGYRYRSNRPGYYGRSISTGIGVSPFGNRSGFGYRSGFRGYGYGGYPGYGMGRSGVSIGIGGFGRGW